MARYRAKFTYFIKSIIVHVYFRTLVRIYDTCVPLYV